MYIANGKIFINIEETINRIKYVKDIKEFEFELVLSLKDVKLFKCSNIT